MLHIAINILLVIHVLVSLLIVLLVLMQRPKNEGLGAAFGGGMTENLFGAQTTNVLQTFTRYLGALFFGLTLLLSWLYVKQLTHSSSTQQRLLMKTAPATVPSTPAPDDKVSDTPAVPTNEKPATPETPAAPVTPAEPAPAPKPVEKEPAGEAKPATVPAPAKEATPAPAAEKPAPAAPSAIPAEKPAAPEKPAQ
jgi:preprotein translocase subunit SecG